LDRATWTRASQYSQITISSFAPTGNVALHEGQRSTRKLNIVRPAIA